MGRALFGTDGVRGIAGEYPLNEEGAQRMGMAIGTLFAKPGQRVIMGCDPRESSAGLVEGLTRGLVDVGVNVVIVGVLPTPGLAYLTREDDFVAGVMVTASHNPVEYNGVKVFDANGDKLTDATETRLNELIEREIEKLPPGSALTDENMVQRYEDFLVSSAGDLRLDGVKIAVDSANGASSGLAEEVFRRLGTDVTAIFDNPDGRNINAGCGATHTEALRNDVVSKGLHLGVALDGDADRVIMCDAKGREVKGDHILYILAVAGNLPGVVATVMSNLGFENSLSSKGIKLERTKVGDRYVLESLKSTGYKLGGEQSGHIIIPNLLATGDGLLAAVQTVRAVTMSGKSLADWYDEVKLLPQALVNLELADKSLLDQPLVQEFLASKTEELADKGRLLIRPSGTEPLVRVMVEAPDADSIANGIAADLKVLMEQKAVAP